MEHNNGYVALSSVVWDDWNQCLIFACYTTGLSAGDILYAMCGLDSFKGACSSPYVISLDNIQENFINIFIKIGFARLPVTLYCGVEVIRNRASYFTSEIIPITLNYNDVSFKMNFCRYGVGTEGL